MQRTDVANAIARNEMFDFLIDIVPRDSVKTVRLHHVRPNILLLYNACIIISDFMTVIIVACRMLMRMRVLVCWVMVVM